jgi:hypothetical protein
MWIYTLPSARLQHVQQAQIQDPDLESLHEGLWQPWTPPFNADELEIVPGRRGKNCIREAYIFMQHKHFPSVLVPVVVLTIMRVRIVPTVEREKEVIGAGASTEVAFREQTAAKGDDREEVVQEKESQRRENVKTKRKKRRKERRERRKKREGRRRKNREGRKKKKREREKTKRREKTKKRQNGFMEETTVASSTTVAQTRALVSQAKWMAVQSPTSPRNVEATEEREMAL